MVQNKPLYLIDGSGFIFRAYHALPPMTRPDGTPIGAVMGFCNMLLRVLEEAGDAYIAIIFDAGRKTFRNDIYPEYKANRSETPEDLIPQFPIIRDACKAFGLASMETDGYEADDLIATYARIACEKNIPVHVISSDKDLMQLTREGVEMVDPITFTPLGAEKMIKKFGTDNPKQLIDIQALIGDSVDNVPGVPGIGPKTAAQLIQEYGNLETLLERASEIKQNKRRENLIEFAEQARLSKKLVTLNDQAPIPLNLEDLDNFSYDHDRLITFLSEQNFRTLMGRIERKFGQASQSSYVATTDAQSTLSKPHPQNTEKTYTLVTDEKILIDWCDRIETAGIVSFDTETNSLTPAKADLVGISLSIAPHQAIYIPVGHKSRQDTIQGDLLGTAQETPAEEFIQLSLKTVLDHLKPILENDAILKVAQNAKYDLQIFAKHGVTVAPIDDTMVLSYILDGATRTHNMDDLAKDYLNVDTIKYKSIVGSGKNQVTMDFLSPEAVKDYAAEDADITLQLYHILKNRLITEKKVAIYEKMDRKIVPILASMELQGIKISPQILASLSVDLSKKAQEIAQQIYTEANQEFNIGSPKQVGDILFGSLGLEGGKKTKTGAWSTDAKTLEELANQGHKIVEYILEWRQLTKLVSTYTDALPQQINPHTGRVHTSFTLTVTNTGRLSSSDPNLQNIPIRTEEGRKIRQAFIAEDGHQLVCVDYSQVELRLIAHMANIQKLQQAFKDGIDIHTMTASEVFGIPLTEMTPEKRRAAKAINFGIIYGISGYGLGRQLGVETSVANDYINGYFSRFPELKTYMDDSIQFARQHGYVETLYGRKIYLPEIKSSNYARRSFAERQAINAPIQGTAADIMKLAMISVQHALNESSLNARMLLQVHDELVFEVSNNDVDSLKTLVKQCMEDVIDSQIPFIAEAGSGTNWDQAH